MCWQLNHQQEHSWSCGFTKEDHINPGAALTHRAEFSFTLFRKKEDKGLSFCEGLCSPSTPLVAEWIFNAFLLCLCQFTLHMPMVHSYPMISLFSFTVLRNV